MSLSNVRTVETKDKDTWDGTPRIKHKISGQDSHGLLMNNDGDRKAKDTTFEELRKNGLRSFLHLTILSIKCEGRRQTFVGIPDFKTFTSHEPFLGRLLENMLHRNEDTDRERRAPRSRNWVSSTRGDSLFTMGERDLGISEL